jgi:hypothetical protein
LAPASLSTAALGSIAAVTVGLVGGLLVFLRASRPGDSVAQLLYETEHPADMAAQKAVARGRQSTHAR